MYQKSAVPAGFEGTGKRPLSKLIDVGFGLFAAVKRNSIVAEFSISPEDFVAPYLIVVAIVQWLVTIEMLSSKRACHGGKF